MQTPFQWFAEAYPFIQGISAGARRAHEDEFIILQKKVNQGAKNRVGLSQGSAMFTRANHHTDVLKREFVR